MYAEKYNTSIRHGQIVEAALDVISRYGVKKLSIATVARRVGIVPSAIYRHFSGKDDILDAVVNAVERRLQENLARARAEATDPLEKLRTLLFHHVQLVRDNEGIPRLLFSEEVSGGSPLRRTRMYGMIDDYLKEVAEIVATGQNQGSIRPELDPQTVAVMFLGLIQPGAILWHLSEGDFDITRHSRQAWAILQEAIEVPADR